MIDQGEFRRTRSTPFISPSIHRLINPIRTPNAKKGTNGTASHHVIRPRFHQSITKSTAGMVTTVLLLRMANK